MVNGQLGISLPNPFDIVPPQVLPYRAHPPPPPPTNASYGYGPPMPRNGHPLGFDGPGPVLEGNSQGSDGHAHGLDESYVVVRNGEEEKNGEEEEGDGTDRGGEDGDVSNRAQK